MKLDGMQGYPRDMFRDAAQDYCVDIAQELVDEIRADPKVPYDTGRMKAGFRAETTRRGATVNNRDAWYWRAVEYGHDVVDEHGKVVGHAHKHPFVRKSWEIVKARHRG